MSSGPTNLDLALEEFAKYSIFERLDDERFARLRSVTKRPVPFTFDKDKNRRAEKLWRHCVDLRNYNEEARAIEPTAATTSAAPPASEPATLPLLNPRSEEEAAAMGYVYVQELLDAGVGSWEFKKHGDISYFLSKRTPPIATYSPNGRRRMVHAAQFIRAVLDGRKSKKTPKRKTTL